MVAFYLGNINEKRRAFREKKLCLDNDEIVANFTLDGKNFFVVGAVPFGDFSAIEYICYERSLRTVLRLSSLSAKSLLKNASFRDFYKPMKRVNPINYKKIQLAAKLEAGETDIYINLDGLKYSRVNKIRLKNLAKKWSKKWAIHIAVSDSRYIYNGAKVNFINNDGAACEQTKRVIKKVSLKDFNKALSDSDLSFSYNARTRIVAEHIMRNA